MAGTALAGLAAGVLLLLLFVLDVELSWRLSGFFVWFNGQVGTLEQRPFGIGTEKLWE